MSTSAFPPCCQRCKQFLFVKKPHKHGPRRESVVDSFVWLQEESLYNSNMLTPSTSKKKSTNFSDASKRIEASEKIIGLAYGAVDPNHYHPLCINCTEKLLTILENELKTEQKDVEQYEEMLKANEFLLMNLNANQGGGDDADTAATVAGPATGGGTGADNVVSSSSSSSSGMRGGLTEKEILAFEEEERMLREELAKVTLEWEAIQKERIKVDQEKLRLDELEHDYWQDLNALTLEKQAYLDERDSLNERKEFLRSELAQISRTNVYNDAFHIWYDGNYGTINGFRCGRLPSHPVEWSEINAGLGHCALLLYVLAKKKRLTFTTYRIIPLGSNSILERLDGTGRYELCGGSGGSFFRTSKFDKALSAMLQCLNELGQHIENLDPKFKVPYNIADDKIGGLDVKYQNGSSEERWTKAMKYVLTNMKWLLSWVSKHHQ